MTEHNAAQDGYAYSPVPGRADIEQAARCGYQDAMANRKPSRDYERANDKWQRNYEIGRLWIASMRAAGIKPPAWPEKQARPNGFEQCLATMRSKVGDIVPRSDQLLPEDPNLVVKARVPELWHGRLRDR